MVREGLLDHWGQLLVDSCLAGGFGWVWGLRFRVWGLGFRV